MIGKDGKVEVDIVIFCLFIYVVWVDKFDGVLCGVFLCGVVLVMKEFVGIIVVFCLLYVFLFGLISVMVFVIVMGNCVILFVFEVFLLVVMDFI